MSPLLCLAAAFSLSLAASDDSALRSAFERTRLQAERSDSGFRFTNDEQRMDVELTQGGVTARHPHGAFGLRLEAYGYGERLSARLRSASAGRQSGAHHPRHCVHHLLHSPHGQGLRAQRHHWTRWKIRQAHSTAPPSGLPGNRVRIIAMRAVPPADTSPMQPSCGRELAERSMPLRRTT